MNALSSKKICVLIFSLIFIVYVLSFILMPKNAFFICDGGVKFIQMKSIIQQNYRDFSIQIPSMNIIKSYAYAPTVHPFFGQYGNKVFSVFSYPFAIISSFFYTLLGFRGLYLFPLLSCFLMLPAIWKMAGVFSNKKIAQPLSVFLSALCTPVWFYSVTFWELIPATALVIWSIWFFVRFFLRGENRDIFISGVFLSFSIYFRDDFLVLAVILAGILLLHNPRKWKHVVVFGFTVGLVLTPLFIFHWKLLGHPLGLHATSLAVSESGTSVYLLERLKIIQQLLMNSCKNIPVSVALNIPFLLFLLIYPPISKKKAHFVLIAISIVAMINGLVFLSNYLFAGNKIMAMRHSNGLFGVTPVIILGLIRIRATNRLCTNQQLIEKILWQIIILFIIAYIFLCPYEHAKGLHWGCRYFLLAYPLLCILAVSNIALMRRKRLLRYLAYAVIFFSFTSQIYSIYILYQRKHVIAQLNQKIIERPEKVVLTNIFYKALDLTPIFYEKNIFLVATKNKNRLLQRFRKIGIKNVLLVFYPDSQEILQGNVEILENDYSLPVVIKPVRLWR